MSTGILPNQDERRKIVERARQQLREACALAERLDQIDIVIAYGCLGNVVQTSTLLSQAAQTQALSFR
jgi:hypothetical protein